MGADSLTNNAGEVWALAVVFLWLRDKSGDDRSIDCTLHTREPKPSQALMVTRASRSSRSVSPKVKCSTSMKSKHQETPGLRVTLATRSTQAKK